MRFIVSSFNSAFTHDVRSVNLHNQRATIYPTFFQGSLPCVTILGTNLYLYHERQHRITRPSVKLDRLIEGKIVLDDDQGLDYKLSFDTAWIWRARFPDSYLNQSKACVHKVGEYPVRYYGFWWACEGLFLLPLNLCVYALPIISQSKRPN